MKSVKLSSIVDISMGSTPSRNIPEYWGDGYPWVSIRDLDSKIVTKTKEQITANALQKARCKIVRKGTLLFSFKLTIGKMAFAGCDLYTNEAIAAFVIKDKKVVHPDYLYYALKTASYGGSNQAVMGKTLNSKSLADIEIPLPPFDDQFRIANLLGKVEGLIAQRKQNLQQLDNLLKSVFLEMFGDPVKNEKGFPAKPLAEFMSEQPDNGLYKPQSDYGSGTKIIRIDSFYDGIVQNIDGLKRVEITDSERKKYEVRPFDILINRVNSIEYLGKIGVVPEINEPVVYESNMMRFRLNTEIMLPVYLMNFWKTTYVKSQITARAKKAVNQASINQQDVNSLMVIEPPVGLQQSFEYIWKSIDLLLLRYQRSLNDLEGLFGALSQKAFRGELDLSRVALTPEGTGMDDEEKTAVEEDQSMKPSFELAAPSNLAILQTTEGRKTLLNEWLAAWVEHLEEVPFVAQDFMDAVRQMLSELSEDDAIELGIHEYDELKAYVFDSLEKGRLTQVFDDDNNRVQVKMVKR